MFQKIWQWIKSFFQGIFGQKSASRPRRETLIQGETESRPLTDTDYEFLFSQLLEGVSHGWEGDRILKFFTQLGERGKRSFWLDWLNRFGEKLLSSASPNQELAVRMMLLEEKTRSLSKVREVGVAAGSIGRQLLERNRQQNNSNVWEYEGPDATSTPPPVSNNLDQQILSLDELSIRLEEDEALRESLAQQLGMPTVSSEELIQALVKQASPQNEPEANDVNGWFEQGLQFANQGNWQNALIAWEKVVQLQPDSKPAWFNRGGTLAMLSRWEDAIASYDKALELQPNDPEAWYHRGIALSGMQNWEDAIANFDKALEIQPDYWQTWIQRGLAVNQTPANEQNEQTPPLQQRGYEGALATYEEALKLIQVETNPEGWGRLQWVMGVTYAQYAENHAAENHWQKAKEHYQRALQTLTPTQFPFEHIEVLKNLLYAHHQTGETEQAHQVQQQIQTLLERQPQF